MKLAIDKLVQLKLQERQKPQSKKEIGLYKVEVGNEGQVIQTTLDFTAIEFLRYLQAQTSEDIVRVLPEADGIGAQEVQP